MSAHVASCFHAEKSYKDKNRSYREVNSEDRPQEASVLSVRAYLLQANRFELWGQPDAPDAPDAWRSTAAGNNRDAAVTYNNGHNKAAKKATNYRQ